MLAFKSSRWLQRHGRQFCEQCSMIGNRSVNVFFFCLVASGLYAAAVIPVSVFAGLDGTYPRWCGICKVVWKPPVAQVGERPRESGD